MTVVTVAGVGMLSGVGRDPVALAAALDRPPPAPIDAGELCDMPLPDRRAHAVAGFDTRAELGRKGTSTFDRRTALTVVTCCNALDDAGLDIDALDPSRTRVVLGTTEGSVRSAVDFAGETFTQTPPHLVNPALFPNTVMNCAAGQTAIWLGLRGVNTTIAGGPVAFLSVLRYCENLFRGDKVDVLLSGAVEELTAHSAWLSRSSDLPEGTHPGEGGAVFVLSGSRGVPGEVAQPDAELLGVALGFAVDPGDRAAAVARSIHQALRAAEVEPYDVRVAALGIDRDQLLDRILWQAVRGELEAPAGPRLRRLSVDRTVGDCGSGTGALEMAAILGMHRNRPEHDGQLSVLAAHSPEGAVGAAVVRGWSRGVDRR